MSSGINFAYRLNEALDSANKVCIPQGYTVRTNHPQIDPKKPVLLSLIYPDKAVRNIGVVHLVRLEGDRWDLTPAEDLAKTTEEIAQAILARIQRFFEAEKAGLYIDENGTIFDFNNIDVRVHQDLSFSVKGHMVTLSGSKIPLSLLKSEGIIVFKEAAHGETELVDESDKRLHKGVYIDVEGNLYRK